MLTSLQFFLFVRFLEFRTPAWMDVDLSTLQFLLKERFRFLLLAVTSFGCSRCVLLSRGTQPCLGSVSVMMSRTCAFSTSTRTQLFDSFMLMTSILRKFHLAFSQFVMHAYSRVSLCVTCRLYCKLKLRLTSLFVLQSATEISRQ